MGKTPPLRVLLAAILASACTPEADNAQGVVVDATMNTLTLVTSAGDTLSFGTENAVRETPQGVLLGDTATVYFRGKVAPGKPAAAVRLVVTTARNPEERIL